MKIKIIILGFIIVMGAAVLSSCSKFLDQVPDITLSDDSIFANLQNTQKYLAQVYANVPDPYGNRGTWTARDASYSQLADESNYFAINFGINAFSYNTLSASFGAFDYLWGEYYKPVRTATDFINKIDGANSREVSDYLKTHFKAEARALRAMFYFWLLRLYGPIPILHEPIPVSSSNDEMAKTRTPFDTCVNYIVKQLDTAYMELKAISTSSQPTNMPLNEDYGRITTGVCLAYKEQVLMLAASPLFNGNTMYKDIVNPDGTHLFPLQYDKNKWQKAADAAKAFIDEFVPSTYDLYRGSDNPDPYIAAYENCRDVISTDWNDEWIFGKSMSGSIHHYKYNGTPKLVGYGTDIDKGGGYNAVNQSMVDAYFMKNGYPINDGASEYKKTGFTDFKSPYDLHHRKTFNQWVDREPRFYVGVTYTNTVWLDQGTSSKEVIVDLTYHGSSGKIQSDHDYSSTGYLLRKNITKGTNNRGWCHLRVAQIYLDYVEALNEIAPGNSDILKYLNLIRDRAGIPGYGSGTDMIPAPANQVEMRKAIHHERQVELAFEQVRYFDLRRWLDAATELNKPVRGLNVDADGDAFFEQKVIKNISFTQRCYLWAIPSSEVRKDANLTQNLGWN